MKLEDLKIAKPSDFTTYGNALQNEKPEAMKQDDPPPIYQGKGKTSDPAKKLKQKVKKYKYKKTSNKILTDFLKKLKHKKKRNVF